MNAWWIRNNIPVTGARTTPDTFLRSATRFRSPSFRARTRNLMYTVIIAFTVHISPRCIRKSVRPCLSKKKGASFHATSARYRSPTCHLNVRRTPHLGSWLCCARTYPPFVRWNSPGRIAKHFAVCYCLCVALSMRRWWRGRATRHELMFTHHTNQRFTRTVDRLAHSRSPNVRLRRAPNRNSRCQRRHVGNRVFAMRARAQWPWTKHRLRIKCRAEIKKRKRAFGTWIFSLEK